jgi:hypothetical protein
MLAGAMSLFSAVPGTLAVATSFNGSTGSCARDVLDMWM